MSNTLAISTVSSALRRSVFSAALEAVDDATVRLGTPTAKLAEENKSLVNIHLYRVETNTAVSNNHLPNRTGDGLTKARSSVALNLYYVISFYGDSEKFVPELMMSSVLLVLEDVPAISNTAIAAAIADGDILEGSNLASALSRVRLTREMMSIDEFSKIWSIFYQVPYALSVAYVASHVVLETEDQIITPLAVVRPEIWVAPTSNLRIDSVSGSRNRTTPPIWTELAFIKGSGLRTAGLGMTIDGQTVDLDGVRATDEIIELPLLALRLGGIELTIGVHNLRLIATLLDTRPEHLRVTSNTVPFALIPVLTPGAVATVGAGATATGTIAVQVSPALREGQEAVLLLDSRDPANPAQHGLSPDETVPLVFPATNLVFAFSDLLKGDYLARLDVEGFLSPVTLGQDSLQPDFGLIAGPIVSVA